MYIPLTPHRYHCRAFYQLPTRNHVQSHIDAHSIAQFYDQFMRSRMLDYRVYGNRRLDRICETLKRFVAPGSRVLELGCGIGIITEFLVDRCGAMSVRAVDISPANIWYATRTVRSQRVRFAVADTVREWQVVESMLSNEVVDVVLLADVVEHIRLGDHARLFRQIGRCLSPGSLVIITYLSAYYQDYLKTHRPEELQPIDESITYGHVTAWAEITNTVLLAYEHKDVWVANQYVHVVLRRHVDPLAHAASRQPSNLPQPLRLAIGIFKKVFQAVIVRWRKGRYVRRPFRDVDRKARLLEKNRGAGS